MVCFSLYRHTSNVSKEALLNMLWVDVQLPEGTFLILSLPALQMQASSPMHVTLVSLYDGTQNQSSDKSSRAVMSMHTYSQLCSCNSLR